MLALLLVAAAAAGPRYTATVGAPVAHNVVRTVEGPAVDPLPERPVWPRWAAQFVMRQPFEGPTSAGLGLGTTGGITSAGQAEARLYVEGVGRVHVPVEGPIRPDASLHLGLALSVQRQQAGWGDLRPAPVVGAALGTDLGTGPVRGRLEVIGRLGVLTPSSTSLSEPPVTTTFDPGGRSVTALAGLRWE